MTSAMTFEEHFANPVDSKEMKAQRRIEAALRRLYNLGFHGRAYEDLLNLFSTGTNDYQRRLAAYHLGLWHANRREEDDAKKALEFLATAADGTDRAAPFADLVVLRAECEAFLGNVDAAFELLVSALRQVHDANFHLGLANLISRLAHSDLIDRINLALSASSISPIAISPDSERNLFDCIVGADGLAIVSNAPQPLISVIVPAFNTSDTISTALESIRAQTWRNLEVLVVDDCSTDDTRRVVTEFVRRDSRFRLLSTEENSGPYIARNIALSEAQGQFVTCHDADDWSHPEKLEAQAKHLLANPRVIANASQQVRTLPDLRFHRRRNKGVYVFSNMSSLMFRREAVLERVGYWDSVRFGADSEFIKRLKLAFGDDAVIDLRTGALCFQRQTDSSLTGDTAFGFHGHFFGARAEYKEAQTYFHSQVAAFRYAFPQKMRPFEVPAPLRPVRPIRGKARHFDVIIASEFRMRGGSTASNVEEIKAQRSMGLKTGLIQLARYDQSPKDKVLPEVREQLREGSVEFLVYGERVSCDLLILRYPPAIFEHQLYLPTVEAKHIRVIVNQTPMSDYGPRGVRRYRLDQCQENLERYFGAPAREAIWHPIGPLVREALLSRHADELSAVRLAEQDWENVIDLQEWSFDRAHSVATPPRIGRHARGYKFIKWPADKESLLSVYPESDKYAVHILGGAAIPAEMLGRVPKTWKVWEYGEISPKEFLANLDVFLYYTHPDWVESFGRVIIEAMAAGVPVILPRDYEVLFGDAALYAEPEHALAIVDELTSSPDFYGERVARGRAAVEERFSYKVHAERIRPYVRLRREVSAPSCAPLTRSDGALVPTLLSFDGKVLSKERDLVRENCCGDLARLVARLHCDAEAALHRGPYSVTHKKSLPPSGCANDYWHPAPYWWPNPNTPDGLPYVRRDGERVPGTQLYEPGSDQYDRTRVQRLFDDSLTLALAHWFSSDSRFANHAIRLLEVFFLHEDTRMTPHLMYAQVKRGRNKDQGSPTGIIELKDFYYYLDGVRLLEHAGEIDARTTEKFRRWLGAYAEWLTTSAQGRAERSARNNHGTYYDVQLGAIADYLGERDLVWQVIEGLEGRILAQFDGRGVQIEELARRTSAHYCCFNFQGWLWLLNFARRWGVDLMKDAPTASERLGKARSWLVAHFGFQWPYEQIDEWDQERLWPIVLAKQVEVANQPCGVVVAEDLRYRLKPVFFAHDGIRPYWNLGGRLVSLSTEAKETLGRRLEMRSEEVGSTVTADGQKESVEQFS